MDISFDSSNDSPIVNFYSHKSIFITGGTGFLGTVLIEKLLYACDTIETIYVLMKPKHGKSVEERLSEFICSQAFQRINSKSPDIMSKIVPLKGDLLDELLGLSDADIATLQNEVSIVFHAAANVKFDVPLAEAIQINTGASEKVVHICKGMRQLQAFVYVSTAYSNSNNRIILEKVYKTVCPLDIVRYVVQELPDEKLVKKLLDGRPNTYTYSKALAEEVIEAASKDIPAVIVRPSIITAALKDPVKGFLSSWSGGIKTIAGLGKGVIRCWNGDPDAVNDIIPVDIVVNLSIASAWEANERRVNGIKEVKVFNCCSGLQNPTTVRQLFHTSVTNGRKFFVRDVIIPPTLIITKNRTLYNVLFFLLQLLPAYFLEGLRYVFGHKRSMLKIQQSIRKMASVLEFFTLNQFAFVDYNVRDLYLKLSNKDRVEFDFNVKNINWEEYNEIFVMGIKKYLFKEI